MHRNSTQTGYASEYKFVPLLSTVNTSQPHTLLLFIHNNNHNTCHHYLHHNRHNHLRHSYNIDNKYFFIHKGWQQIRHGDAHDIRTQNLKSVH